MKTTTIKKIVSTVTSTILLAGVCALGLAFVPSAINLANAQQAANAATEPTPKVVEISAKKFEFSPAQITLKKGEPVILRLSSSDRVHGFMSKPLKIDTDIPAGASTDVNVTPDTAGDFTIICDHYCGTGHGNMKLKVTVVQ